MLAMSVTPDTSQPEMGGTAVSESQLENMPDMFVTPETSQFEMGEMSVRERHPANMPDMFVTPEMFQFEMGERSVRDLQSQNKARLSAFIAIAPLDLTDVIELTEGLFLRRPHGAYWP